MPPDEVLLPPPHTVLKTSSGKIRRTACREIYEAGRIGASGRRPWLQLVRIAPSVHHGLEYRPCRVTLKNGAVIERVYVVPAREYHEVLGVWPEEDEGKKAIDIAEVADIAEGMYQG